MLSVMMMMPQFGASLIDNIRGILNLEENIGTF
jgi:hypothetical protein